MTARVDAAVIGGGFYGCRIALALREMGFGRVLLVERERGLMRRASYVNQARVHGGYHYPRSLPTAERSRRNFFRFIDEYRYAIDDSTDAYYAIARGSRVTVAQFQKFCDAIDAPCAPGWSTIGGLFDASRIEDVFRVNEHAFNAVAIADRIGEEIAASAIEVRLNATARIVASGAAAVSLDVEGEPIEAGHVFNCTYANIDGIGAPIASSVKRELAEMLLIDPPAELRGAAVTVMDGPYFSVFPFPAEGCYSLSHVRYTPHAAWHRSDQAVERPLRSNHLAMLRNAASYMPCLSKSVVRRPIFEVKAVLARNEGDDGRPILFERSAENPRITSILGAKIDNIYDVIATLRSLEWDI